MTTTRYLVPAIVALAAFMPFAASAHHTSPAPGHHGSHPFSPSMCGGNPWIPKPPQCPRPTPPQFVNAQQFHQVQQAQMQQMQWMNARNHLQSPLPPGVCFDPRVGHPFPCW